MDKSIVFLIGMLFGVLVITIVVSMISISPMDVYQGKTTLKYEVVDGVVVDSVVVWKDNY